MGDQQAASINEDLTQGWSVRVARSKRRLRPLKTKNKEVSLDTIRRLDAHKKLMAVQPEDWKMLKLTVDSGAGESVIPEEDADNVPLEDGDRKGCRYEVADGHIIHNKGQKRCAVVTRDGGSPKLLNLQVSDVHKGLLSVIELVKSGYRVVFDEEWSYIQDKSIGLCDTMDQGDDSFELVTWVKPADKVTNKDFGRRGS